MPPPSLRFAGFALLLAALSTGASACAGDGRKGTEDEGDPSGAENDAGTRDAAPSPATDARVERVDADGSQAVSADAASVVSLPPPDAGAIRDAGATTTAPPEGLGSWSRGTLIPTARTELAVALLDGKIYVAGGYGGLTAFEAYDPASDTWEKLKPLPAGREHPSLAALDGIVYLTGGNASETYAYDAKAATWTPRKSLLFARYAAAAVALDGALYLLGGTGPSAEVVQKYDPKADTWTARASLSMVRDHIAAVALNGKIYALGGRPGRGAVYDSVEIYDPIADRFDPGPKMLEGRSGFGAAVVNGKIYVAGGEVLVDPFSVRDTAEGLDPTTGVWTFKATLPTPLHGTGAVGALGKMFLFGGATMPASATVRAGGVNILTP